MEEAKKFPAGMVPLGETPFRFACHAGVACFTRCCRRQTLRLYPYDVLSLKQRLNIGSEEFLERFAGVVQGDNPFFPTVVLRMSDNAEQTCPFLDPAQGCTVYADRPAACRTYPLERAVDRNPAPGQPRDFYFLTRHDYCLGHAEEREWQVREWLQDQRLAPYLQMEERWAEMDTLFATNPWRGEGAAGPRQLLAFMICYNIDRFRQYVRDHDLLKKAGLDKARRRAISLDDEALLSFGFDWLKQILASPAGLPGF